MKHFMASSAGQISQNISRITLHFIFFLLSLAMLLLSVNQKEAGISTKLPSSKCNSPFHGFTTLLWRTSTTGTEFKTENYISITYEMGHGMTSELVFKFCTEYFQIWHMEVKWHGQLAFNCLHVQRLYCSTRRTELVGVLSPVSNTGLHQGWMQAEHASKWTSKA